MESCRNEFVKQKLQEDYLDFIKKACETNKHISSKALIEKNISRFTGHNFFQSDY